jgi:hypothetical protein
LAGQDRLRIDINQGAQVSARIEAVRGVLRALA